MLTLWRDVRFTFRSLAKNWTFTVAAVTALGLGIGATSTTFSFIRPFVTGLPMVDQQDRLMFVWSANVARGTDKSVVSLPDFADWRDANRTFSGLAVAQSVTYNLSGSDRPVRVAASQVSANYFSLLGVSPQIGRTFREGEDRVGSPVVAVLSHGLWQRAFGAEAGVVGRDILLDGSPATVIGVMPQGFEIQFGELWLPLTTDPRSGDRKGSARPSCLGAWQTERPRRRLLPTLPRLLRVSRRTTQRRMPAGGSTRFHSQRRCLDRNSGWCSYCSACR